MKNTVKTKELIFAKSTGKVFDKKPSKNIRMTLDEVAMLWSVEPTEEYKKIGVILKEKMDGGLPYKEAKKHIEKIKNGLPYMLASGFQDYGHDNESIIFNGCLQLDIDFKFLGGDMVAKKVLTFLGLDKHILLMATSPSGYGVKALVSTNCMDADYFENIVQQVKTYFENLIKANGIEEVQIDTLSLSQPLFIPMDVNTHYNPEATIFPIKKGLGAIKKKGGKDISADVFKGNSEARFKTVLTQEEVDKHFDKIFENAKEKNGSEPTDGRRNDFFKVFTTISLRKGLNFADVATKMEGMGLWCNENKNTYTRFYNAYYKDNFAKDYKPMVVRNEIMKSYNPINQTLREETVSIGDGTFKYVSQFIENGDLPMDINFWLYANTGTGKTHAFLGKKDVKLVFASPTTAHVKQNQLKYGVDIYCEDVKTATINSKVINTTYSSLGFVSDMLKDNKTEYTLVIDEAHNFITSTSKGYLLKTMTEVLYHIEDYKNTILLTATPLPITQNLLNGFTQIGLVMDVKKQVKTVNRLFYSDRSESLKDFLEESKKKNEKTVIYLNNTDELGALGILKNDLIKAGLSFVTINSKTKGEDDYNKLVIDGIFEDDLDVIICTSLFKEGIDTNFESLENNKVINYVVLSKMSSQEIEQLSNRVRNAEEINIYIFEPNLKVDTYSNFDFETEKEKAYSLAEKEMSVFMGRVDFDLLDRDLDYKTVDRHIENAFGIKNFLRFDKHKNTIFVDDLLIGNTLYNKMKTAEGNDFWYLMTNLAEYGFVYGKDIRNEKTIGKKQKKEKEEDMKDAKEIKEMKIDQIISKVLSETQEERIVKMRKEKDELTNEVRLKVIRLAKYGLTDEDVEKYIKEVRNSDVKFQSLTDRINNTLYQMKMKGGELSVEGKKAAKAMWSAFDYNKRYLSKDILDIMVRLNKDLGLKLGLSMEDFKELNMLKTFQTYFQTKSVNIKNSDGKYDKGYEVTSKKPLDLNFKKI